MPALFRREAKMPSPGYAKSESQHVLGLYARKANAVNNIQTRRRTISNNKSSI